ncbi:hypothetical protein B0H19DRAFT_645727 [Mycena capillaripes]|nr:hypothetical protein B0H19DRAFT_645727 [Mycena capillaripes]
MIKSHVTTPNPGLLHPQSPGTASQLSSPTLSDSSTASDESYLPHFNEDPRTTVQVLGTYSSGTQAEVTYGELYDAVHPNQRTPVVIKTYWMEVMAPLTSEVKAYRQLESLLQGGSIPQLLGIIAPFPRDWVGIVMENVGPSLASETWDSLTWNEKNTHYNSLCLIHRLGVEHGDIALRNIARRSDGALAFVDFGNSRLHTCPGEASCDELVQLNINLCL